LLTVRIMWSSIVHPLNQECFNGLFVIGYSMDSQSIWHSKDPKVTKTEWLKRSKERLRPELSRTVTEVKGLRLLATHRARKGQKDSAWGFNPRNTSTRQPALKGRKMFAMVAPSFICVHFRKTDLPPLRHLQPAMRVQFGLSAVLQQFANPTPLFEHEHEDDFDAPCER